MNSIQDSVLNTVVKTNTIRIGVSENYPPLSFTIGKDENGIPEYGGVEIEMAKSFTTFLEGIINEDDTAQKQKISITWVQVQPSNYIKKVKSHQVDLLMGGVSRNSKRSQKMWFSEPYFIFTPAVLFDRNKLPQSKYGEFFEEKTYRTLWDLKKLNNIKLAVKEGSVYKELIQNELPNVVIVDVQTNKIGLNKLKAREVDGFVHDSIFYDTLMHQKPGLYGSYILLKGGTRKEVLCIGLPMGDTIWLQTVNSWLVEVKRTGQLQKWIKKYAKGKL